MNCISFVIKDHLFYQFQVKGYKWTNNNYPISEHNNNYLWYVPVLDSPTKEQDEEEREKMKYDKKKEKDAKKKQETEENSDEEVIPTFMGMLTVSYSNFSYQCFIVLRIYLWRNFAFISCNELF